MNSLPTGTVTFLFTDIEGSTRLAQEFPDRQEALRERHQRYAASGVQSSPQYWGRIQQPIFCRRTT